MPSLKRPDQHWGPHNLLFNIYMELVPTGKAARAVKPIPLAVLLLSLRISGTLPPLPHTPLFRRVGYNILTLISLKREDQQDATIRCLLLTSVSTCFGHYYAHLQLNKGPVTAFSLLFWFCWMWLVVVLLPLPTTSRRTRTTHQMQ